MCGIFGAVSGLGDAQEFLNLAEKTNQYRGPDETNYYRDIESGHEINFGHTRLVITGDLNHGKQPVVKDKLVLVYNGEIFNFDNVHVGGTSDTEILADLLASGFSNQLLNSLNGFFAFAAYYPDTKTLYLVRDRFGEKPLYYKHLGGAIYFSSTATPFRTLGVGEISSIEEALGGGILFDEVHPANGIFQVPPGHVLSFKNGQIQLERWYKFTTKDEASSKTYAQVVDSFEGLFNDAVRLRVKDQDAVAVSLSGGLDSTLVADTIKRVGKVKVETFTLEINDPKFNELELVKRHASKLGVDLNIIQEPQHDLKQFTRCLEALEFPSYNFSFVGYDSYYDSVRKKGIRVILEGHGPDEYLGGYAPMLLGYIAGRLFRGDMTSFHQGLQSYQKTFGGNAMRTLRAVMITAFREIGVGRFPSGKRINQNFFELLSMPIVLRTFDRMSMLNQIETRSPFMDYRLVEFGRSLPDKYLFYKGRSKSILRTILEARGFSESDFGPKVGFTANYNSLLQELRGIKEGSYSSNYNIREADHKKTFKIASSLCQKILTGNEKSRSSI